MEKEQAVAQVREVEAQREQLKEKVREQEKALQGDPMAPSNRMLRAKIKAQIQTSTLAEGWTHEGAKTQTSFNGKLPEDLTSIDDLNTLRAEVNKLRTESRGLQKRLKAEKQSKDRWEQISRQREQDLSKTQEQLRTT